MIPKMFDCDFVQQQLNCFGLTEYKSLIEQGYPHRIKCDELLDQYNISLLELKQDETVHKQVYVATLLRLLGLQRNDFKFGNSCVCLRPLNKQILGRILKPSTDECMEYSQKVFDEVKKCSEDPKNESFRGEKDEKQEEEEPKDEKSGSTGDVGSKTKKAKAQMKISENRFDRMDHLPGVNTKRNRCRLKGCSLKTNNYCMKCQKHLCIKQKNNCFFKYHNSNSTK